MDFTEPPLPCQHAPGIKSGSNPASIDGFQSSLSVACLKAFGLCRQWARSPDREVMPGRKMQTLRGFLFHTDAKRRAFNVMSDQRTEKNDGPYRSSDNDEDRNRYSANQNFPSQGSKVTKVYRSKLHKRLL